MVRFFRTKLSARCWNRGVLPASALAVRVAVVCGSGLGGLADALAASGDAVAVPYASLPGFPAPGVAGHGAELLFGSVAGVRVVAQRGRFHGYEGHAPRSLAAPVRLFAALGARVLIVSNAAGGLRPGFAPGDVMLLTDHLSLPSLAGASALAGANAPAFGARFPPMTAAYSPALRALAAAAAARAGLAAVTRAGVYAHVSGPAYETPAEVGALRALGADAVGMSTAPEVLAAAHAGVAVLGLSLITNACRGPGDAGEPPSHEEVLAATAARAAQLQAVVADVIATLPIDALPAPPAAAHFAVAAAAGAAAAAAAVSPSPAAAAGARARAAADAQPMLLALLAVGFAGGIVGGALAFAAAAAVFGGGVCYRRQGPL